MLFLTPIFLILTFFIAWAFIKSVTRFKHEYGWYKHFQRSGTNRVCRTIVSRNRNCTHHCPNVAQPQAPTEQQFYPTAPYQPQMSIMEMSVPYSYAQQPYYYNPPAMHHYLEPPPSYYPGVVVVNEVPHLSPYHQTPTAPPFETKE